MRSAAVYLSMLEVVSKSGRIIVAVGAAFIKKLAGLKKKQKKFHVFFSKLVFGDQNKS